MTEWEVLLFVCIVGMGLLATIAILFWKIGDLWLAVADLQSTKCPWPDSVKRLRIANLGAGARGGEVYARRPPRPVKAKICEKGTVNLLWEET